MLKAVKDIVKKHLVYADIKAIADACGVHYVSVSNFLSDKVKKSPAIEAAVIEVAKKSINEQISKLSESIAAQEEQKRQLEAVLELIK